MKIAVITPLVPTPTNEKGPTGLLYSLLLRHPSQMSLDIYFVNHGNFGQDYVAKALKELNVSHSFEVPRRRGFDLVRRLILVLGRGLPFECALHDWSEPAQRLQDYDKILVYTFWPIPSLHLDVHEVHILGPDCASLHHLQTQHKHPKLLERLKSWLRKYQFINLERYAAARSRKVYFVGLKDKIVFDKATSSSCSTFMSHPLAEDVTAMLRTVRSGGLS